MWTVALYPLPTLFWGWSPGNVAYLLAAAVQSFSGMYMSLTYSMTQSLVSCARANREQDKHYEYLYRHMIQCGLRIAGMGFKVTMLQLAMQG